MSLLDKAKHKAEEIIGEVKEKVGELTGNEELATEGKVEQVGAEVKQAGDTVGDKIKNVLGT